MYRIEMTREYSIWFASVSLTIKRGVEARITRIKIEGHFGDVKRIDSEVAELRWKNGLRVYFGYYLDESEKIVILLLGGNKNTQKFDIKKAQKILKNLIEE